MTNIDLYKADDVASLDEFLRENDNPDDRLLLPDATFPEILRNAPPLISVCAFFGATRCFNFLQSHNANLTLPDRKCRLPVHFASAGSFEICDLLESIGADFTVTDAQGMGCIHFACQYGNLEMVQRFAIQEFDLNLVTTDNLTPLHFACMSEREDIVEFLLEKDVPLSPMANDGRTPLLIALKQGSFSIVKVMVDHQVDLNIIESNELTPLMWACKRGFCELVSILLDSGQVDVNQRDLLLGWTALHFAAEKGDEGIVRELISRNAFVNAKTKAGMTPLHFAMNRKHMAVQVLLDSNGGIL